jgi:uncharacterized protein (TIGR01777 family)
MRVFVTGASGLVGRRLVAALCARGDQVIGLSRRPHDGARDLRWVIGDASNFSSWRGDVDGCDAVVNLAGGGITRRWSRAVMADIVGSRVGITTALYHALAKASVRPHVLISASEIGYYGYSRGDSWVDETSAAGDGFLAGVCREWEVAAERSEELEVRVVRMRIGAVLAREGGPLVRMAAPVRAFVGGALGDGQQWVSWIHIDDVVAMMLWALGNSAVGGALNAVAPNPVRQGDLVRGIGKVLGRPVWLDAPALVLKTALGTMATEALLGGQRVRAGVAVELGFEFSHSDLAAALQTELDLT